jgi:hypothetical protein
MRNVSEDAIRQVLEGLRDVETPNGMERRILDAVQDRASVRSARMPLWGWSAALTCAMVALFAVSMAYRVARTSVQMNVHSAAAGVSKGAVESTEKSEPQVVAVQGVRLKTNAKRAKLVRDSEPAESHEMHAASFPAPPMPLTEQEKLLLRIAHRGDPEELAMLNQEIRDKREADSNAEFQRFFEPAITGDSE